MAFDTFLKIDGIDGESTDSKHKGWIELIRYSSEMIQTVSRTASSAGGASAERVDINGFGFTKLLDKASPLLALACADGTHINTIALEICRAGTDKLTFMRYTMRNCIISSVQTSGTQGESFPSEDLEIDFGQIEWRYTVQKRAGGIAAGNIVAGWNLEKNARV
jgi:type VI secretion system secreted protein Hcp